MDPPEPPADHRPPDTAAAIGRAQVPGLTSPPDPAPRPDPAPEPVDRHIEGYADPAPATRTSNPASDWFGGSSAREPAAASGGFALPEEGAVDRYAPDPSPAPAPSFELPDQEPVDRYAPPAAADLAPSAPAGGEEYHSPARQETPAATGTDARGGSGDSPWAAFANAWDEPHGHTGPQGGTGAEPSWQAEQSRQPEPRPTAAPPPAPEPVGQQPVPEPPGYDPAGYQAPQVPAAGEHVYGQPVGATPPEPAADEAPPAVWPPAPAPWPGDELAPAARGVASVPAANRISADELAGLLGGSGSGAAGPERSGADPSPAPAPAPDTDREQRGWGSEPGSGGTEHDPWSGGNSSGESDAASQDPWGARPPTGPTSAAGTLPADGRPPVTRRPVDEPEQPAAPVPDWRRSGWAEPAPAPTWPDPPPGPAGPSEPGGPGTSAPGTGAPDPWTPDTGTPDTGAPDPWTRRPGPETFPGPESAPGPSRDPDPFRSPDRFRSSEPFRDPGPPPEPTPPERPEVRPDHGPLPGRSPQQWDHPYQPPAPAWPEPSRPGPEHPGPTSYPGPPRVPESEPGSWQGPSGRPGAPAVEVGGRGRESQDGSGTGGGGPGAGSPWSSESSATTTADTTHRSIGISNDTLPPARRFADRPGPAAAPRASGPETVFATDPPPRPWTQADRDGAPGLLRDLNPLETTNSLTGRILGPRDVAPDTAADERHASRTKLTVYILIAAVVALALIGVALWVALY